MNRRSDRAKRASARAITYWIATVLAALLFLVPGVGDLAHWPHFVEGATHLGYPAYFLTLLGVWKILGAAVILAPGVPLLKEWAYAGMMFDISGAFVSRAVLGDPALMLVVPFVIGVVVCASWALRPAGRRLYASHKYGRSGALSA
jgi:uncharacterized membrane protein YphA (DoxX/SURF4 family)